MCINLQIIEIQPLTRYNKARGGVKYEKLLALISCLSLLSPIAISAQDPNKIEDLQAHIKTLETQLQETRQELILTINETDGLYVLESNTSTYIFSNPRLLDNHLLLDVDLRNDTKGRLDINSKIWALQFSQEDDATIRNLWLDVENIPGLKDRTQFNQNIIIKSGVSLKFTMALSYDSQDIYDKEIMATESQENLEEVSEASLAEFEFSTEFPLHVRIDGYLSPNGMTQEIIIDLQ